MKGLVGGPEDEPHNVRVVRWVRLAALLAGMVSLVLAFVVLPEAHHARDWAWSIGVALLVLTLVANRLIPKSG